jgi:hypothetical protein
MADEFEGLQTKENAMAVQQSVDLLVVDCSMIGCT